jgi:hypothetical protein
MAVDSERIPIKAVGSPDKSAAAIHFLEAFVSATVYCWPMECSPLHLLTLKYVASSMLPVSTSVLRFLKGNDTCQVIGLAIDDM